jgi:methionine biosynthesis protein MetW
MDKKFYDHYWGERGISSGRERYHIFAGWIDSGSTILDIGCGDGFFSEFIKKKKHCKVVSLDISLQGLKIAKKKRDLQCILSDAQQTLPFRRDSFNYVICSEFLEHIPNPEKCLQEIKRVGTKYLLVSIPNIAYWKHRLRLLKGRFPKQWTVHPFEHLRYWSVPDFIEWIGDQNLKVEEVRPTGFVGRLSFLREIFPNLFGNQICFKIPLGDNI